MQVFSSSNLSSGQCRVEVEWQFSKLERAAGTVLYMIVHTIHVYRYMYITHHAS